MSEDKKTIINKLLIVWQGQSWSVISSEDGSVLARFKYRDDALKYANDKGKSISETSQISIGDDGELISDAADDSLDSYSEYFVTDDKNHEPRRSLTNYYARDIPETSNATDRGRVHKISMYVVGYSLLIISIIGGVIGSFAGLGHAVYVLFTNGVSEAVNVLIITAIIVIAALVGLIISITIVD